jgi:hypothetical protein
LAELRHYKRICRPCTKLIGQAYRKSNSERINANERARRERERQSEEKLKAKLQEAHAEIKHLKSALAAARHETRPSYSIVNDTPRTLSRVFAERDEMHERVKQLEGLFRGDEWIPEEWGLTGRESEFLAAIVQRSPATREYIHTVLYGLEPDGGPDPKILDTMISKMRVKLAPHEIVIETNWGIGYQLSADTLKKCRALRDEHRRRR